MKKQTIYSIHYIHKLPDKKIHSHHKIVYDMSFVKITRKNLKYRKNIYKIPFLITTIEKITTTNKTIKKTLYTYNRTDKKIIKIKDTWFTKNIK
jgi:hypothetical protein